MPVLFPISGKFNKSILFDGPKWGVIVCSSCLLKILSLIRRDQLLLENDYYVPLDFTSLGDLLSKLCDALIV